MKIVFNNEVDFLELEMDCVPRIGEAIYYDEDCFTVSDVEYCIHDDRLTHVNVMLTPLD